MEEEAREAAPKALLVGPRLGQARLLVQGEADPRGRTAVLDRALRLGQGRVQRELRESGAEIPHELQVDQVAQLPDDPSEAQGLLAHDLKPRLLGLRRRPEDLGEEVKAVVQPMPGVAAGPDLQAELIGFCRENLAHMKCPRSVDFTDQLPRGENGKLYKKVLREAYWASTT